MRTAFSKLEANEIQKTTIDSVVSDVQMLGGERTIFCPAAQVTGKFSL